MSDVARFERIGARHDMDGVYEKFGRDAGFLLVFSETEKAEAGNDRRPKDLNRGDAASPSSHAPRNICRIRCGIG